MFVFTLFAQDFKHSLQLWRTTLRNYAVSAALIIAELVTVKCAVFAIFIL